MSKHYLTPLAVTSCLLAMFLGGLVAWKDRSSTDLLDNSFIQNMYQLSLSEPDKFRSRGFGGNSEQLVYWRKQDKVMFSIHNKGEKFVFYFKYDPPEYPVIEPMELDLKSANLLFDSLVFPDKKVRSSEKRELEALLTRQQKQVR